MPGLPGSAGVAERRRRAGRWAEHAANAFVQHAAYDPDTGEIFFASGVANGTSIGVGCANVLTMRSCGYTQLATSDIPNADAGIFGAPGMAGGKQVGIARRLGITPGTVKTHLTTIYRLLDTHNRVQAARYYLDHLAHHPPAP